MRICVLDIELGIKYIVIRGCSTQKISCSCSSIAARQRIHAFMRVFKQDRMHTLGHWLGRGEELTLLLLMSSGLGCSCHLSRGSI